MMPTGYPSGTKVLLIAGPSINELRIIESEHAVIWWSGDKVNWPGLRPNSIMEGLPQANGMKCQLVSPLRTTDDGVSGEMYPCDWMVPLEDPDRQYDSMKDAEQPKKAVRVEDTECA